jgi:putative phosphoribosyl transferase
MRTELDIPVSDASLQGTAVLPPGARGLVVFAHGSGSTRLSPRNLLVAQVLQHAGFGTLLFDLLTRSEEAVDRHTMEFRFNIGLLSQRLVEVTGWVGEQTQFQGLPIGYFGASTGSAAALVAASRLGERIGAVVSRGGRPDLAGNTLQDVAAPTLLIVGASDLDVIELNQDALSRLRCEKKLRIIPGASHLFEEAGTLQAAAALASDWFTRHLPAAKTPPARASGSDHAVR